MATAANLILTDLYVEFAHASGTNEKSHIATLTIMSLFARLIDGYLGRDLGNSGGTAVQKKWRETSRKLLAALTPEQRRTLKLGAKKLQNDFQSSVQSNVGAQAISSELGALCLAICVQYPKRHLKSSDYARTKEAVFGMIKAFERRVVS